MRPMSPLHKLLWLVLLAFTATVGPRPATAKEAAVNRDGVALTASCGATGRTLTRLDEGQRVTFRFALSGSSSGCYSVSAEVDGQEHRGYVAKDAVSGLEECEERRREASHQRWVDSAIRTIGLDAEPNIREEPDTTSLAAKAKLMEAAALLQDGKAAEAEQVITQSDLPADNRNAAILRARALLQLTRPREAFAVIDEALRTHGSDADLLAMAGLTRLQLDDIPAAKAFLERSLTIQPSPSIQSVLRRVERESAGDASSEKTYGTRFAMRYEGGQLDPRSARELTQVFDREVTRISQELGCNSNDRLAVIIQSRENYSATTGAADWSGGRYDGRIRIALAPGGSVDAETTRTFSHEYTHACLASLGSWPSWLHEGIAQRMAGDTPHPQQLQILEQLGQAGQLPKLRNLAGGWARLDARSARVAYTLALVAIQKVYGRYQTYGVRTLLAQPTQLPQITRDLDESLQAEYQ